MTPVEEIRRAAQLMREQAEAEAILRDGDPYYNMERLPDGSVLSEMSAYEASWHPGVALTVADWLDKEAHLAERLPLLAPNKYALAVARAYLGGAA